MKKGSGLVGLVAAGLLYGAVMYWTEPETLSDTLVYSKQALGGDAGGRFNRLWEFGHLLWRPLAAVLHPVFQALAPAAVAPTELLKNAYGLIWLNLAAGLLCSLLLFRWMQREKVWWGWSLLLLLAFVSSNAFLLHAQTGSSYVFGLALMMLALELDNAVGSGLLMAGAALLWFPYVLMAPAVLLKKWLERGGWKETFAIAVAFAGGLAAGYGVGAWLAGVRSAGEFLDWYAAAKHTWSQNRQWLRAVSGVCRLLYDLGQDGVLLKRLSFRDPYALVAWTALAPTALRMAAFYGLCGLCLWRGERARVWVFGMAAAPMLFFAIVLFEPGSPERFLPMLPLLFWLASAVARDSQRWVKVALAVLLVAIPMANLPLAFAGGSEAHPAAARLLDFKKHARVGDLLVTVTFRDPMVNLVEQHPFLKVNAQPVPPTYQLIEIASSRAAQWQEDFAKKTLATWPEGDVWVQRGVRDERPPASLWWVEGDNPAIRWRQVPEFFGRLEFDRETAHPEGFLRLRQSEGNRSLLERIGLP